MITLRDYASGDIDRLVALANNVNVSRYLVYTFPYPYTHDQAQWWIETGASANGAITKVIEYHGQFVGSVGLLPQIGWREHVAEIGYWLGEAYWGKGIASQALAQMSELGFSKFEFQKLFATVLTPNKASARILEKNDYRLEGLLEREVMKNGVYYDVLSYAKHATASG